ncbi:MAG: Coenzyme F420 hydrogenase/dehydrogenase, beta subunit C-terminal domain [Candidatus Bathyarchaeia archaeon]
MAIEKVSFEETLKRGVVERGLCVGCAACVISCPFNCLEYADHGLKIISECKVCGICARICPRFNLSLPSLERIVFGRERRNEEEFGIYKRILVAQTTSDEVRAVCQDGGVVTSLLISAFEEGIISGAAASHESVKEPLRAAPKLALSRSELLECSGTRYTYSPNLLALKEGVQKKIGKIAFIGTPCQIHALRKIQAFPLKKYADAVSFSVGLFCSESFTYDGLVMGFLHGKMGIRPEDVARVNIKGKMLLKMKSGEVIALPIKEIREYACSFCSACPDFSAELADISVGGLGLEGWSLTVIRTDVGDEIFRRAESKGAIKAKPLEDKRILDLLIRMSRRKRENLIKSPS